MGHHATQTEFLTVRHTALVIDASTKTVRRYIALPEDPLPAIRLGVGQRAPIRIPRRELLAWLERRRARPVTSDLVDEIVQKAIGDG